MMLSVQNASFSKTAQGYLCIALDDAAFVRADIVFLDLASRQLTGLLGDVHFTIGTVPADLGENLMKHPNVILTAPHPQGHELALLAPITTLQ